MRKKILALLPACLILTMLMTGCGTASAGATGSDSSQVAGAQDMTDVVDVVKDGMVPLYGSSLKDGTYEIAADSSSSMFKITQCELTKFFTVLFCAVIGVTTGAQPIFSFNYGSRNYGRVLETLRLVILISLGIFGFATAWFQLAPESIVRIFGSGDALYNEFSVKCLKVYLALIILDAFELPGSAFFQAIGKPLQATILIVFRQIVIQVPAMLLFARTYGVEGILYSGPLCNVLVGALALVFLWRERRRMRGESCQN